MRTQRRVILSVVIAVLVITGGLFYLRQKGMLGGEPQAISMSNAAQQQAAPNTTTGPFPGVNTNGPSQSPSSVEEDWVDSAFSIIIRLLMAVILSGVLAFRPRRDVHLFRRSLFVSQTQILLAVVAAALMMIVGDNTARAFAIFAAVSLVRFRTNIRDPKEITVLLISLALGLAAGVGRWELGIALCLFALALLWLLEYNESSLVFRSMELKLKTKDTEKTDEILKRIFRKYEIEAEAREIDPQEVSDGELGEIVYYLNLRLNLSIDRLNERILKMDPENVEKIQWSQKKTPGDIYQ